MDSNELKKRTMKFAMEVVKLAYVLPNDRVADVLGRQLIRSATSVGANYRSACRSRSKADFISRITIVEEEADESLYWLEMIRNLKLIPDDKVVPLIQEADELVAIFVKTIKTAKQNK